MKLSFSALYFFEFPIKDLFSIASKLDFKYIEFHLELYHVWLSNKSLEEKAKEVLHLKEEYGIDLQLHAPYIDINLLSYNNMIRETSKQQTLEAIKFAGMAEIDRLTLHLGKFPFGLELTKNNSFLKKLLKDCLLNLKEIYECGEKYNVAIGVENLHAAPGKFPKFAKDFNLLLEELPELKITFDLAHAYTISGDVAKEILDAFHDRIINIHVSNVDRKTNAHHIGISYGKVDFVAFFKTLKKYHVDVPIVMELDALKICKDKISDRNYREEMLLQSKKELIKMAETAGFK